MYSVNDAKAFDDFQFRWLENIVIEMSKAAPIP